MSGLEMRYFVLKPRGTDAYAVAARDALLEYADSISGENPDLASDIREWVRRETAAARKAR